MARETFSRLDTAVRLSSEVVRVSSCRASESLCVKLWIGIAKYDNFLTYELRMRKDRKFDLNFK